MLRRGSLVVISVGLVGTALSSAQPVKAQDGEGAAEGIPVTSELVVRNCSRCHQQDDDGRMSRISYLRKTPEGWSQSIRRMVALNDVSVDPEDAREIVRYLANRHGLAPEELRPVSWEVERRHLTERPEMSEVVRETCTACHTLGRIATQRRTPEEWKLVTETHRGLYPLIDRQRFRRGSVPEDEGDFEFPVDAAVARLAEEYPLETTAWGDWTRNMRPARIEGRWALRGREIGQGPLYGTVTVSADGNRGEDFGTTARYVYPAEDRTVERSGQATVYTGYQWRGSSSGTGGDHGDLREVMLVERDWDEMSGRWFTGAYEELGVDVEMVRIGTAPLVLGAYPEKAMTGSEERIRIFGANLPEDLTEDDVDLGTGVEVLAVEEVTSDRATVRIRVEEDARTGARDAVVSGARGDGALVVYEEVDYIRVEPHPAIARTGGGNFDPGYARFEAVGYADGVDGERDTDDDVRIGVVEASWSLVEYPRTWDDDDVSFVGEIDQDGRFTPAVDGPNPDRSGLRNNIGEVWVRAEHRREGASDSEPPLHARGFLVIAPPNYIEWQPRDDVVNTIQTGGNR